MIKIDTGEGPGPKNRKENRDDYLRGFDLGRAHRYRGASIRPGTDEYTTGYNDGLTGAANRYDSTGG